jgi:GTP-binding protein Era
MVNQRTDNGQGESLVSTASEENHRCGFIAVSGRPNVGKSTLVNRIVGTELCIVTRKAQTTRNRITAIHSMPEAQMILVDTPGIHEPGTPLNRAIVDAAVKALEDSDAALMLTTPSPSVPDDDRRIMELLKSSGIPAILGINKIDMVEPSALLPVMDAFSRAHDFKEIIPLSALNGDGVDELTQALAKLLPPGPPLFPEDDVSDLPLRFFVAEIIREQVTIFAGQEIPYKTAVVVEAFKELADRVVIHADIHAERESQKKILIGKGGKSIKRIGTAARKRIEEFLDRRVHLELFVKVSPHWTRNKRLLEELGYRPT